MRCWQPVAIETKCQMDIVILCNCIQVNNEEKSVLLVTEEMVRTYVMMLLLFVVILLCTYVIMLHPICLFTLFSRKKNITNFGKAIRY